MRVARRSCRPSVAATYICSGNPAAAGSSRALMTLITPDDFSRRTRFSVAAGDSPTRRDSSTFVRSASACSSVSSCRSISSSSMAMTPNIILSTRDQLNSSIVPDRLRDMTNTRRLVFPALLAAGVLWGTTVPLSKVALGWLPPALAGVRQVRPGRRGADGGEPVAAARRGKPGHPGERRASATAARSCSRTSASSGPA